MKKSYGSYKQLNFHEWLYHLASNGAVMGGTAYQWAKWYNEDMAERGLEYHQATPKSVREWLGKNLDNDCNLSLTVIPDSRIGKVFIFRMNVIQGTLFDE